MGHVHPKYSTEQKISNHGNSPTLRYPITFSFSSCEVVDIFLGERVLLVITKSGVEMLTNKVVESSFILKWILLCLDLC